MLSGCGLKVDYPRNLRIIQTMFLAMLSADPWAPAPVNLWPNNDMDRSQFALRGALTQQQAKEFKLEEKIRTGRTPGLARDHYLAIRKAKLERLVSTAQGDKAM